jgi:hypothetical protein
MSEELFDQIEHEVQSEGPGAALDLLARQFLTEKKYPQLFEARLMQKRLELGLPLIQFGSAQETPEEKRGAYQQAMVEAAREVGSLFLAEGDIVRAWPYFRAIGEREPVKDAIDQLRLEPQADGVIDIALGERVHPAKGLELTIAQHGICRAITYCEQFPNLEPREECYVLLVCSLHRELVVNLQRVIAQREGQAPDSSSVLDLVRGRDWLFGEYDSYVDTAHVVSVIRFATDLEDSNAIRLALELCEYGAHLSQQFKLRGEPPFEDLYTDYAVYLRALVGEEVDDAIAHFRRKLKSDDPRGAEVLIGLLARLERYPEALEIALEHLRDSPTALKLCQLAGDPGRLKELARERGDLLSFTAGAVQAAQPPILRR